MTEVPAPILAPDAMEGVVGSDSPPTALPDAVPEEPEYTSETLYIQNLNEKIKIEGNLLSTHCVSGLKSE
jgi:hypothetical protein